MKIALLLRGIAYNENYMHPTGQNFIVDFRKSINNYNEYIFQKSSVDVFYHTYLTDNLDVTMLNSWLKPVSYNISMDPEKNNLKSTQKFNTYSNSTISVINLFIDYCTQNKEAKYDYIILTRFDLIFKVPLSNLNLNKNNFMISCLAGNNLMDDNFFIGNIEHYKKFLEVLCKRNNDTMMHCDYTLIRNAIGANNISFLFPGIHAIYRGCPLYNILRNFRNLDIFNNNEILIFNHKNNKFLAEENNNIVLKSIPTKFKLMLNNSLHNILVNTSNCNNYIAFNSLHNKITTINNIENNEKTIITNFKINTINTKNQLYTIECNSKYLSFVNEVLCFTNNSEQWNIFVTGNI